MTVVVNLTAEEIAEIQALTNESDVEVALRAAMTEYLRYARRQQLKSLHQASKRPSRDRISLRENDRRATFATYRYRLIGDLRAA